MSSHRDVEVVLGDRRAVDRRENLGVGRCGAGQHESGAKRDGAGEAAPAMRRANEEHHGFSYGRGRPGGPDGGVWQRL